MGLLFPEQKGLGYEKRRKILVGVKSKEDEYKGRKGEREMGFEGCFREVGETIVLIFHVSTL